MKKIYLVLILISGIAFCNSLEATNYYSKSAGLFTTFATWGTNTDGSGTAPTNFNLGVNTYYIVNRATFNHVVNFNLNGSQTVVIGDGINPINLTISSGGIISNATVDVAASATLTIQKVTPCISTFGNLNVGSTVVYNASGVSVLPLNYGNVTINQNAVLSSQIYIYGNLNIASGATLDLNGLNLNLDAKVLGTGQILSNSSSGIYFTGAQTGNIGTLFFSGASPQVKFLDITFGNPSAYFKLGNDLTITGGYLGQNSGGIDLNGHSLTVDAASDVSFPAVETDGVITGSASSSLFLNGTVNGNNLLYMDQTSSATRTLKSLGINSSAIFLTVGNDVEITDSLSVPEGNLDLNDFTTLKSTNTLKGRVARIIGGSITGNLKVETFAKGGSTGWTVMAPAGISGLTVSSWDAAGIPMTCVGCINDPSTAYGFVSIDSYNEAGSGGSEYVELTSVSPLTEGKGYWTYLGDGFTTTNDLVWTTTGAIVTGNVPVTVTKNAGSANPGSNLVGNPYACPISWAKVLAASSGLNNAIYVFNPDLDATTQYVGGVASPGGTTGITDIIPMGQGFYIDATSNTTVNFTENAKVSNNTSSNPLLKTSNTSTIDIGTVFRLKVDGFNGESDETVIRFHSNATTAFDGKWDARKFFQTPGYAGFPGPYSAYTTISTKSLNQDYSINSLPPVQSPSNTVIPVLVKVPATGQYTISPLETANLPAGSCIILKDKLLGINHDLRTGPYICTIADTTSTPRFELTVCSENVAPTGVNSVTAADNSVIISQTAEGGAFVKTAFQKDMRSVISAYNVMGQKIMDDKEISGTSNLVFLDFKDTHNQIVIIRVTTDKAQTTKKVYVN